MRMLELPTKSGLTETIIPVNPDHVSHIFPVFDENDQESDDCLVWLGPMPIPQVNPIPVKLSKAKVQRLWEDVKGPALAL